jgi:glutathione S-transferase
MSKLMLFHHLALNSKGVVPTIVHNNNVVIESTVICEYLDETFALNPLRPGKAFERAQMRLWTKQEDGIHDAINTVTSVMVFCPLQRRQTTEQQAAWARNIPDLAKRQKWEELMRDGMTAPALTTALVRLRGLMNDMESALTVGPWLVDNAFSIADIGLVPFFARLEALSLNFMFHEYPRLAEWLERAKQRKSFTDAIAQFADESGQRIIVDSGRLTQEEMKQAWRKVNEWP